MKGKFAADESSDMVDYSTSASAVEVTDSSCRVDFIEIVPASERRLQSVYHTASSSLFVGRVVEVELEDVQRDVKREPADDETDCEDVNCYSVKQEPLTGDEYQVLSPYALL